MKRWELAAACAGDVLIGDPPALPHPVRAIGYAIAVGEKFLRERVAEDAVQHSCIAGVLLCGAVTLAASLAAAAAARIGGHFVAIVGGAAALAARSLDDAVQDVESALERGDLSEARRALAAIVGRDTAELDEGEIARAALETSADSLCDGVVAPLLALRIGGLAGAWAFKAISTLDSMIGHTESPYTYLGRAAALSDDAANFIPARLTVMLLALAAAIAHEDGAAAIKIAWRDGPLHRSPNAGWCEAALAGALHVRLGGDNHYGGKLVRGALFAAEYTSPRPGDIARARNLVRLAAFFAMIAAIASAPE
jgi:adenosylcobinamide-phosphate synthase